MGEFEQKCGRLKVDFLAMKDYIKRIVSEQEAQVYRGNSEVSLDSIVLTSAFQLQVDATAGTEHVLRIFPVLSPPVLGLNPERTHTLKITFTGLKGRGIGRNAESLRQKCLARLQSVPNAAQFCDRPESILLESIVEAVENNKGSGG